MREKAAVGVGRRRAGDGGVEGVGDGEGRRLCGRWVDEVERKGGAPGIEEDGLADIAPVERNGRTCVVGVGGGGEGGIEGVVVALEDEVVEGRRGGDGGSNWRRCGGRSVFSRRLSWKGDGDGRDWSRSGGEMERIEGGGDGGGRR